MQGDGALIRPREGPKDIIRSPASGFKKIKNAWCSSELRRFESSSC